MAAIPDEISSKDLILKAKALIEYLKPKWFIILVISLIGGSIGFTIAFFKKPVYTASLSFVLEDDKSTASGINGLASQFGFDVGGGNNSGGVFSGNNLAGLIQSRFLVERTLLSPVVIAGKEQSFAEAFITINNLKEGWTDKPELSELHFLPNSDRSKFTIQQDSILGSIYNGVSTYITISSKDKKTLLNSITVAAPHEAFAKYFVEALARQLADLYIQTKVKKASDNVAILQRQTDSVRKELNAAISGVANSGDATYNLNPAFLKERIPVQRRQFDIQSNTLILTELIKNLELAKVSLMKETPLIQVIDKPILPLKKDKISKRNALILGLFLGGIVAVTCMVARRMWQQAID